MIGTVKQYNYEKLYGFIVDEDDKEYFFTNADFKNMPKKIKDRKVIFDIDENEHDKDNRPRAKNISTASKTLLRLLSC